MTEADDIKRLIRYLVYETLRDAQAIAQHNHSRFRSRDTRKADPNRKTRAPRKHLHPNVILGRAKQELREWIYSPEFYHYLCVLDWEDPVRAIRMIEEFAQGEHAKQLDAYLDDYRSLKQGHAGKPLNRRNDYGQQKESAESSTAGGNPEGGLTRRTSRTPEGR